MPNYEEIAKKYGGTRFDITAKEFGGVRATLSPEEERRARFRKLYEGGKGIPGDIKVPSIPGELARGVAETVVGVPARFVASATEVPGIVKSGGATSQKTYDLPGLQPFRSYQSAAETTRGQILDEATRPETAPQILGKTVPWQLRALQPFVEVPLAGLETATLLKGAMGGAKRGISAASKARSAASKAKEVKNLAKIEKLRIAALEAVEIPIPKKPGYIPKPSQKITNFPLSKMSQQKGFTVQGLLGKLGIDVNASVDDIAKITEKQMPAIGKKLRSVAAKADDVDVSSVANSLKSYADRMRKAMATNKANLADELAINLTFAPEADVGRMPMSNAVDYKQLWDGLRFRDPATKWRRDVYREAAGEMRDIVHQNNEIAMLDEAYEALATLKDATRKAKPALDKALTKWEMAVEKTATMTIRRNAVDAQRYKKALAEAMDALMKAEKTKYRSSLKKLIKMGASLGGGYVGLRMLARGVVGAIPE